MTTKERSDTRRWLNRYRWLNKEIQARERELFEFIRDTYNPLKATVIEGMPNGSGTTSDQTLNTVIRIENMYGNMMVDMQNTIDDLVLARNEIEDVINSCEGYERLVLLNKYLLGVYWVNMPAYVSGYEERQLRNIEKRALEKIHKQM